MSTIEVWSSGLQPGDVIPFDKELGFAVEVLDPPQVTTHETQVSWVFPAVTYSPTVTGKLAAGFAFMTIPTGAVKVIRPGWEV